MVGQHEENGGTTRFRGSWTAKRSGQACAYKVGMLKIQELRERAQQELGDKFDQREFHDAVLKNGALPLEILEEQINLYVQKKRQASPSSFR